MSEPKAERTFSGDPVESPEPAPRPDRAPLVGERVRLEPVDPKDHAAALFATSHDGAPARALWSYMPYGPFDGLAAFTAWLGDCATSGDPLFFALRDTESGRAAGMASYLNIHEANRTIEIGHIWFAPAMQRTRQATEALFLMIRHAFDDLAYRRVEWKCNALNTASREAALRLGFTFEGIFYQHMVVKGRNRDSAWFSILDGEWPAIRANFERWLAADNFDSDGRQRVSLGDLNRRT